MSAQLIPLDNSPNQSFSVTVNVSGVLLSMNVSLSYNSMAGYWVMTVRDLSGNYIVDCIPLLGGNWPAANVLRQNGYMKIGSVQIINASGVQSNWPDDTNLGSDFVLIWDDGGV